MNQIAYESRFGPIRLPDGYRQDMQGRSIEEQFACIAVVDAQVHEMSYHMVDAEIYQRYYKPLNGKYYEPIVSDGVVVGVMNGCRVIMLYDYIFSDSASDNNGAGYKYRATDYYLAVTPRNLSRPISVYPPFGAPEPAITVPVTEVDYDVELPEEFLTQIQGKTIAQQLDYYWVLSNEREIKPMYYADPSVYQKYWSEYRFPKLLRYDPNVQEIFVKDGVIVGVTYLVTYPEYSYSKSITFKIGEVVAVYECFENKYEDCLESFSGNYFLQPILYK